MLKFALQNSKLRELARYLGYKNSEVIGFDIPAGYTCPAASLCQAYSDKRTGKIVRGKGAQFLCYAAKLESAFPAVRRAHWFNFETLKTIGLNDSAGMADAIIESMPRYASGAIKAKVVRIHTSGDFFNQAYFDAWKLVAERLPEVTFFGYTKVLPLLSQPRPDNMHLAYSHGGKYDAAASESGVTTSYVVSDIAEAESMGLPVACPTATSPDDYGYIVRGESFALVFH